MRSLTLIIVVAICAILLTSSDKIAYKLLSIQNVAARELTYHDLYPIPPVNQRIRTNTMIMRPDWRWTTRVYPKYQYN